jgi:hypothetical protein
MHEPICTTDKYGTKEWWVNGEHHRIDGPAFDFVDGRERWCIDGKYHRIDGPAVEWADGSKYWYLTGKLHRIDGPAIEDIDGTIEWYLSNIKYSFAEFITKAPITQEEIAILKLKYS